MADGEINRGRQDAARIDSHDDYEIAFWRRHSGSMSKVDIGVVTVGASAKVVGEELGKTHA